MLEVIEDLRQFIGLSEKHLEACMDKSLEENKKEWSARISEPDFYRRSVAYLFDLAKFHVQPGRERMRDRIRKFVRDNKCKVCCDYGSGIGSDAMAMIEAGAEKVYMIDYEPSQMHFFALWRLEKYKMRRKVVTVPLTNEGMPQFDIAKREGRLVDLVSSIATLEHCQNPAGSLEYIRNNAEYAILRPDPSNEVDHPMHHTEHFPYLQQLLDAPQGTQVHGFEVIDQQEDPHYFKVIQRTAP